MAKKKSKKPVRKAVSQKKKPQKAGVRPINSIGIEPLGDRVVVKPLSREEGKMLPSGIIIPETIDKEKPEQGTVVAVGSGKHGDDNKIIPMSVKVGDKVMFSKYGYDEIKVNGVDYFIISENNILAILTK